MYVAKNVRRTIKHNVLGREERPIRVKGNGVRLAVASHFCSTDESITRSLDVRHHSASSISSEVLSVAYAIATLDFCCFD